MNPPKFGGFFRFFLYNFAYSSLFILHSSRTCLSLQKSDRNTSNIIENKIMLSSLHHRSFQRMIRQHFLQVQGCNRCWHTFSENLIHSELVSLILRSVSERSISMRLGIIDIPLFSKCSGTGRLAIILKRNKFLGCGIS